MQAAWLCLCHHVQLHIMEGMEERGITMAMFGKMHDSRALSCLNIICVYIGLL